MADDEELSIGEQVSAPVPSQPLGQMAMDEQKDRIANRAADYGWSVTARDPDLVLAKAERTITIGFNNAGMPKSATWGGGDEFASRGSSGLFHMNELYDTWLPWDGKDKDDDRT